LCAAADLIFAVAWSSGIWPGSVASGAAFSITARLPNERARAASSGGGAWVETGDG